MKQLTQLKPFLFIALAVLFIVGCKESTNDKEVEETSTVIELNDESFKNLWEKVDALWEQRDLTLIHTVYADKFIRKATGGTSTSAEELTNELNAVGSAFPDMKLNLLSYDIRGDMVSVNWSVDGNFTGEIAGLKGNGKPYSVLGITVITVENGKIVKDDSYWDTFAVFRQTGGYDIVEVEPASE